MPTKERVIEEKYETEFTVDLTPTSGIYEGVSRSGYSRSDALREFSDNSYDEYHRARKDGRKVKDPMIRFIFDTELKEIMVEDNMGGISRDRIEDVLKPGKMMGGEERTVGYFAMGLKAGGLSLGDFIIVTWNENEQMGVKICLNKDNLVMSANHTPAERFKGQYTLPDGRIEKLSQGMTRFIFHNLKNEHRFQNDDVIAFVDELGETYGILANEDYPEVKMEVVLRDRKDGKKVESSYPVTFKPLDEFKEEFIGGVFSPDSEMDYLDTATLSKKNLEDRLEHCIEVVESDGSSFIKLDDDLLVRVIVGLAWQGRPTNKFGADVYMNNRLISKYDKISFGEGFGGDGSEKTLFGQPHPTWSRMRSLILIYGPNGKTPSNWMKNALDASNRSYYKLKRVMNKLYSDYKDTASHWDTNLNAVIVQHKEVLMEMDRKLIPPARLDAVRVQSTGASTAEERKVDFYTDALKELVPKWRRDATKEALVKYVTKKFSIPDYTESADPARSRMRRTQPTTKKPPAGKISVRKSAAIEQLMNRAKDIFKERSRVVTPTDSQVVIECLKFYVKSGTPKKAGKKKR